MLKCRHQASADAARTHAPRPRHDTTGPPMLKWRHQASADAARAHAPRPRHDTTGPPMLPQRHQASADAVGNEGPQGRRAAGPAGSASTAGGTRLIAEDGLGVARLLYDW